MKLKFNQPKATAEQVVKDIRRATRRHYSTEDKIRIVLSGLRGEDSIAELCLVLMLYGRECQIQLNPYREILDLG